MRNCYFSRIIIFPCTIIKSCNILSSHFSLPDMPMRTRMVCITRMMRYDEWLAPTARILIHILLPPLNTPTRNRFDPDRNPRRNQRLILCGFPCRELRTRVLLFLFATPHGRPCLRLRTRSRNHRCCRLMCRRHPARGGNCSRARSEPASPARLPARPNNPSGSIHICTFGAYVYAFSPPDSPIGFCGCFQTASKVEAV